MYSSIFVIFLVVIQVNPNGKIPVVSEQTNVEHIYAIGDCTSVDVMFHESHWANPELTPVAVQVRRVNTRSITCRGIRVWRGIVLRLYL